MVFKFYSFLLVLLLFVSKVAIAQRTDSLVTLFVALPYPQTNENSFWVHDEEMQPLQNAVIKWSNSKISGEVKQSDSNGIYTIPKLEAGVYKLSITAEGYEPQIQYIQVYHNAILRKRIALNKLWQEHIYIYTLFGPFPYKANSLSEYVSFINKKPMPAANDVAKTQQFEKEIQDAIGSITIQDDNLNTPPFLRCIHWPAGGKERDNFRKQIEQSDVIKTSGLYLGECGGFYLTPDVTFKISAIIREDSLRSIFKNTGFDVLQLSIDGPSRNEEPYWNVLALYTPPLSLDFLREINTIAAKLPVLGVQMDGPVLAELNTRKN